MMGRAATLVVTIIGVATLALTMGAKPRPRFVWNASASVPIGLYSVEPIHHLTVTTLVIAAPPQPLASFLAERGYLPLGVPLIKRILALPGQSVCRKEFAISVDGIAMGMALARDRRGRALPIWQGCRMIAQGEVFLMNWDEPASPTVVTSVRSRRPRSSAEPNPCGRSRSTHHAHAPQARAASLSVDRRKVSSFPAGFLRRGARR